MFVVLEYGEITPELDDGRKFAIHLVDTPDGVSCSFIDGEHGAAYTKRGTGGCQRDPISIEPDTYPWLRGLLDGR